MYEEYIHHGIHPFKKYSFYRTDSSVFVATKILDNGVMILCIELAI